MDTLRSRLKNLRNDREIQILCRFQTRYPMSELNNYISQDTDELKTKLSRIVNQSYYDYIEDRNISTIHLSPAKDLLNSLFSVYDITVVQGDYIDFTIESGINSLLDRAYRNVKSPDLSIGSIEKIDIKVSKLEMCLIAESRDDCHVEQDLLHEFFVASMYTNRLRRIIPNFQLHYAGIKASRPDRINAVTCQSLKSCQEICPSDTSQTIDYAILENLAGKTMTEALKECTTLDFLSWMTQITLALELGVIHCGFTHNNLQPDNIIITSGQPSSYYFHNNRNYRVVGSSAAVIINFELAHVKHKSAGQIDSDVSLVTNRSEHFGPVGFENIGIFHKETRPFYDIYKILMWSLRRLQKDNPKVFESVKKIARFFGYQYARDLYKALDDEEALSYIYSTTISEMERTTSLGEFLEYLVNEIEEMKLVLMPISSMVESEIKSEYAENPLCKFRIRDIINRHGGLKKRRDELSGLSTRYCALNSDGLADDEVLCEPATEEFRQSNNELEEFESIVQKYRAVILKTEWKLLDDMTADVERDSKNSNVNPGIVFRKIAVLESIADDIETFEAKFVST